MGCIGLLCVVASFFDWPLSEIKSMVKEGGESATRYGLLSTYDAHAFSPFWGGLNGYRNGRRANQFKKAPASAAIAERDNAAGSSGG